jgi:hypothetical protein
MDINPATDSELLDQTVKCGFAFVSSNIPTRTVARPPDTAFIAFGCVISSGRRLPMDNPRVHLGGQKGSRKSRASTPLTNHLSASAIVLKETNRQYEAVFV